jgi:hypothetical protein
MYILYIFEAVYIAHDISLEKKGLECIRKPQARELSRLCPETSTKLSVHEFGFRTDARGGPRLWVPIDPGSR